MTALVFSLVLFLAIGFGFIFVHLVAGKLLRPIKPDPEKQTIYECGEPTIGSAWVQFDLRYYVVALLFVIFDVEVAFFFPWAVVFGNANSLAKEIAPGAPVAQRVLLAKKQLLQDQDAKLTPEVRQAAGQLARFAFLDIAVFFGVLLVGFAYLWKRGDLNWVRSMASERFPADTMVAAEPSPRAPALVGAGGDEW